MINEEGHHSNVIINDALNKYERLDPRDKALLVKLIHGTLEYQIRIDRIIDSFSSIKVRKMKPLIRNVLRMSVYQLIYMDKIPDNAVCDEAVKLIKKSALSGLSGFVNGVLRSIARGKDSVVIRDRASDLSVPGWMYELLADTVGEDAAEDFFRYSLEEHGVSVRKAGTEDVFVLEDASGLTETDEWKQGKLIVQDYSSTLPVIMADIKPGQTVLDVCAAPGGKSILAAEKTGKEGRVISCDLSDFKIDKIRENILRMNITNIETMVQDATVRDERLVGCADVVLADCPCSGIGTISKKPEIKNRLKPEDCRALADIQHKILCNVCEYVKPGGKLVYSTCTLDHIENEDNLRRFLESHPEFKLLKEKVMVPSLDAIRPFDGFYIAVMTKNA